MLGTEVFTQFAKCQNIHSLSLVAHFARLMEDPVAMELVLSRPGFFGSLLVATGITVDIFRRSIRITVTEVLQTVASVNRFRTGTIEDGNAL
jgi:hypothetical protein